MGFLRQLTAAPHRLFFFTGVVQLLLASSWWVATLALRAYGIPAPVGDGLDAPHVHAFLMIYAFLPLFIFGFLFTAGPRWLDLPPPTPREYLPPGLLACVSALLLHGAIFAGATVFAATVLLYLSAWAWMLARFVGMIRKSRLADRRHAMLAASALALGACGVATMVAWALTGDHHVALAMIMIGLWGFLVPIFCIVCHRMIPFFTASVLPFVSPWRPMWTLAVLIGGSVAHGALVLVHLDKWTWLVDLPLGVGAASLAVRWGFAQSFANRLLAMLHVGFAWLGIAYLLHAVQSLLRLFDIQALGLAPVHAVTMGFLASTTIGMVSRVSCGHSGNTLAADRLTWVAFWGIQAAALLRVLSDIAQGAYGAMILTAAALWCACFAAWAYRYLPIYWRPRADGRPG